MPTKKKTTKRKSTAKISTTGKQIMTIAKRIRKANPRKKWQTCVKEAGKEWKRKN